MQQFKVRLAHRFQKRGNLDVGKNLLPHFQRVHLDTLNRIFYAPAASNAKIEHCPQIPKKCVVNARTRASQLVLDFRSRYFAGESIMQRAKTRQCATECGQVGGGSIALRINEFVEHRFEGHALLPCVLPVKHLLHCFKQTDSSSV
jgi:hypothetical protein